MNMSDIGFFMLVSIVSLLILIIGLQIMFVMTVLKGPMSKELREDIIEALKELPFYITWKPIITIVSKIRK